MSSEKIAGAEQEFTERIPPQPFLVSACRKQVRPIAQLGIAGAAAQRVACDSTCEFVMRWYIAVVSGILA